MFATISRRIASWVSKKDRVYLLLGVLCLLGSVTLTAHALLTVSNSGLLGDGAVTIDGAGVLNLGTASSTAVVIGNSGIPVTIPGTLTLGSASSTGQLIFRNASTSFTTTLQASSSQASNLTLTLPPTLGTSGQAMLTDGTGNLYFGDVASSQWLSGASGTIYYNSGNVGINTSTPTALLSLVGSSSSPASLFNISSSSGASLFNVSGNGTVTVGTTFLAACNGTDDTAMLNMALSHAGHQVLYPGTNCLIKNTLVILSNTWLDLNGATISADPALAVPMLWNTAAATSMAINRQVNDGGMTISGFTVTSATANFTSADVGRSITLHGAGSPQTKLDLPGWGVPNPSAPDLYAHILTVNSATSVTVDMSAYATATAQVLIIYNKDYNIKVSGGTIARGAAPGGLGSLYNTTNFRRVDNLTITDMIQTSNGRAAGGAYAWSIADATHVYGSHLRCETFSDCWHITGPASDIVARDLTGHSGDDFTAITTRDWPGPWNLDPLGEVYGPVSNILIDGVTASSATGLARLECEPTAPIRNVTLQNYVADAPSGGITLSDGSFYSLGGNCDIGGILIDGLGGQLVSTGRSPAMINVGPKTGHDLTIRNVSALLTPMTQLITIGGVVSTTWERISIDGITGSSAVQTQVVAVSGNTTVSDFSLSNLSMSYTGNGYVDELSFNGTLGKLAVRGIQTSYNSTNPGGSVINFASFSGSTIGAVEVSDLQMAYKTGSQKLDGIIFISTGAVVNSLQVSGATFAGVPLLRLQAGSTLSRYNLTNIVGGTDSTVVTTIGTPTAIGPGLLSNISLTAPKRLGEFYGTAPIDLTINNVAIDTVVAGSAVGSALWIQGPAVTIRGSGTDRIINWVGFQRNSAEVLHSLNQDWPTDVRMLTPGNGDKAYNTNAASACGVGPIISDGVNYKNLYSGVVCN